MNSFNKQLNDENRKKYLNYKKLNNQGKLMTIIKYNSARDIDVLFENGLVVEHTYLNLFNRGSIKQPEIRCGYTGYSKDGDMFRVIKYVDYQNVFIEFQDKWHYKTKVSWQKVKNGSIKNPYKPNKYGGIVGTGLNFGEDNDFSISESKEYDFWYNILCRCKDNKFKKENHTYMDCAIDDRWLYFWNFYKWLHSQENFNKWNYNNGWAIDKDILIKNNKIYSPETCCLVPKNVNNLFLKSNKIRGDCPIGVTKRKQDNMFESQCRNPFLNKYVTIGVYQSEVEAFIRYKKYKEDIIKQVAQDEYNKGNITEKCYEAMMKYEVEITD